MRVRVYTSGISSVRSFSTNYGAHRGPNQGIFLISLAQEHRVSCDPRHRSGGAEVPADRLARVGRDPVLHRFPGELLPGDPDEPEVQRLRRVQTHQPDGASSRGAGLRPHVARVRRQAARPFVDLLADGQHGAGGGRDLLRVLPRTGVRGELGGTDLHRLRIREAACAHWRDLRLDDGRPPPPLVLGGRTSARLPPRPATAAQGNRRGHRPRPKSTVAHHDSQEVLAGRLRTPQGLHTTPQRVPRAGLLLFALDKSEGMVSGTFMVRKW